MIRILRMQVVMLCFCAVTAAAGVQVTVYNQDMALVRERREIRLDKGLQRIEFTGVAARIDPTSVHFQSVTPPGASSVIEQNFEYDLVSHQKLLEKYIGREIEIERRTGRDGERHETVKGTLLSASDGLTVRVGDRILLNPPGELSLPSLPEGLVLRPTLSWLLENATAGKSEVEVDYLTHGIGWSADYVIVSGNNDTSLGLTGWVTVNNRSGVTYPDAKLKLVAGDVHRAPSREVMGMGDAEMMSMPRAAKRFEEKTFFEYHLYTLDRPTNIRNNETKQIEFVSAAGIPAQKMHAYYGAEQFRSGSFQYQEWARTDRNYGVASNRKVSVTLEFKNSRQHNLGIPLPKGKIRVYKQDADTSLEFVGEDLIDHTPKDETVRLYLGDAFDIVGERTRTDFQCGENWCQESFKITLRNHKDEPVEIKAVEPLYRWSNWKITNASHDFVKKDSRTVEYPLRVPGNGEKTVTYTVRYWW